MGVQPYSELVFYLRANNFLASKQWAQLAPEGKTAFLTAITDEKEAYGFTVDETYAIFLASQKGDGIPDI
jgi:hypothetical protein